jgi:mitogen-activated protein kinase organizer 1
VHSVSLLEDVLAPDIVVTGACLLARGRSTLAPKFGLGRGGGMAALLPLPSKSETTLLGHDGAVMCVAFNSDGNYCLSGGQDRTVKLWNPAKGSLIKTYSAHAHAVLDVSTAKDNAKIASVGGDKNGPFYWDVASGRVIRKFRGHTAKVNAVSFVADDTLLVTRSYDRSVRVWDCRSNS